MVGVAVKVNEVLAQLGFVPVVKAIDTEGVTVAVLLIVIPEDVAVAEVAQAAFVVITQLTTSEFANVELVNVVALVPASAPFTFH